MRFEANLPTLQAPCVVTAQSVGSLPARPEVLAAGGELLWEPVGEDGGRGLPIPSARPEL